MVENDAAGEFAAELVGVMGRSEDQAMMGMNGHLRAKVVWITPELIQEFLTVGNQIRVEVIEGLPEGAVYQRAYYDEFRGVIGLIFYHPDFELAEEGTDIKQVEVTFKRLDE